MKSSWVKALLLILFVFVGWVVLIFGASILTPDNQTAVDQFSNTAFLISLASVTIFSLFLGYIRLFNRVTTMRSQCEGKKQQIETEKIELEELIKRMKAFFTFYNNESTKQSSSKVLLESLSDIDFRATGSQLLLRETIQAITSDQTMKSNAEFQQMMSRIVAKEASISQAKRNYNNSVSDYNAYVNRFPIVMIQHFLGLSPIDYYYENSASF